MLRSFRLSNHRSFLDEQELLLMPSAPGREHEVLTVAAIYGANASGKSNLLDGLRFMSDAVCLSFKSWSPDGGVPRKAFRLSPQGQQPSIFVAEFIADDVRYTYGFSADDHKITEEWLYSYPEKRKRVLFEREESHIRFGTTIRPIRATEVLETLTRDNALFLSVAAQSNLAWMMPAYRWFAHNLLFRIPGAVGAAEISKRVAAYLAQSKPETIRRMTKLLAAADTGISKIHLHVEQPSDPRFYPQPRLSFGHGDAGDVFEIEDESAGTVNWLNLLPSMLDALDHGRTLVVDEIDSSLHPLLTEHLVQLFKDGNTNPKKAQLIFTSHDTTLLGNYALRDVLERDHIWFVEKHASGQSQLYPLTDFKPRKGENTEKRYLSGSYGAVPVLGNFEFEDAIRR